MSSARIIILSLLLALATSTYAVAKPSSALFQMMFFTATAPLLDGDSITFAGDTVTFNTDATVTW
jgi:hypothetical protein